MIHLGAIGAVVRSTALLKAIHRKYPGCHLTWVTDSPSHVLLQGNPLIDRVLSTDQSDLLVLGALEFDIALIVDKSLKATGVLRKTKVEQIFGFVADPRTGAILPATSAAQKLWELGLDNHQKFFENQKTEIQLVHEALELGPYQRDDYFLPLTQEEKKISHLRRNEWQENKNQMLVGINTGASPTIPYKKLSIENHRELIHQLFEKGYQNIVLLGGKEDAQRNLEIGEGLRIHQSPTNLGLRDGLVSVNACDIIITGDSLGMHMAIACQKFVVAWFGPTCAQEIELYGRGRAIKSKAKCGPCWKRLCAEALMCYDLVALNEMSEAVQHGELFCKNMKMNLQTEPSLSFKPLF